MARPNRRPWRPAPAAASAARSALQVAARGDGTYRADALANTGVDGAEDSTEAPDFAHITVLLGPTLDALAAVPAGWVVDCTLGGGGHSEGILRARPDLRVLGLDRDEVALAAASARLAPFGDRFVGVHAAFADVTDVLDARGLDRVSAAVADLGVSSPQLDRPERGFSFRFDGPLDMRMDPSRGESLLDKLRAVRQPELVEILRELGDVDRPGRAARVICEAIDEGVEGTAELAARVARVLPGPSRIHPATRVFQALRMWVNDEAGQLARLIETLPARLAPGGVLAIISFHSGEDRIVKHAMRELAPRGGEFWLPSRKPIDADAVEVGHNPRARSARLRLLARRPEDA